MTAAVAAGFTTLHVLPHIDPVTSKNKPMWRNVVKFSPLAPVGPDGAAFSYYDILMEPVGDTLQAKST